MRRDFRRAEKFRNFCKSLEKIIRTSFISYKESKEKRILREDRKLEY